jgi:hypothetical protein
MPTLEIKLTVPEGTTVRVSGMDAPEVTVTTSLDDPVERYFNDYLSNNGRKVYGAAARIEDFRGRPGFTFEDLARNLRVDYETVKSWHRTAGRAAKRWRKETGTQEPIRFDWIEYKEFDAGAGERTAYRLPQDVAEIIRTLPTFRA